MNININGVTFQDYERARPSTGYSEFIDKDGATLIIKTTTLIKMYELVKFDLELQGTFDYVLDKAKAESCI